MSPWAIYCVQPQLPNRGIPSNREQSTTGLRRALLYMARKFLNLLKRKLYIFWFTLTCTISSFTYLFQIQVFTLPKCPLISFVSRFLWSFHCHPLLSIFLQFLSGKQFCTFMLVGLLRKNNNCTAQIKSLTHKALPSEYFLKLEGRKKNFVLGAWVAGCLTQFLHSC